MSIVSLPTSLFTGLCVVGTMATHVSSTYGLALLNSYILNLASANWTHKLPYDYDVLCGDTELIGKVGIIHW